VASRLALLTVAIAAIIVLHNFAPRTTIHIVNTILIASIGAMSLNLLMGMAGLVSIGNAAFMAIGAYSVGLMEYVFGPSLVPPVARILVATAAGACIGVVVALVSARMRDLYLVIATMALNFIVIYLVERIQIALVGFGGFSPGGLSVLGYEIDDERKWLLALACVSCAVGVVINNLQNSQRGRVWNLMRDSEVIAEGLGVSIVRERAVAFGLSSGIIAMQGALLAYYVGVVQSETFTFDLAVSFIAMIVIGGVRSVFGGLLGAAFVAGMPHAVDSITARFGWFDSGQVLAGTVFNLNAIVYGLAIIGFLIWLPGGIVSIKSRSGSKVKG
jgi:branched-chain amino acid transport system permease protein